MTRPLTDLERTFGCEYIHVYTRAQAIEDGVLVDVTDTAERRETFTIPVALTRAVYEDCVAWTKRDAKKNPCQDEKGRLWDVLYMAKIAAGRAARNTAGPTNEITYQIHRVPRVGHGRAKLVTLKLHIGGGDQGEPVVTIMQPHED